MEIQIVPFKPELQEGYRQLLFEIFMEYDLLNELKNRKPSHPHYSWLALDSEKVVGSAGLLIMPEYAVLKRMFLLADYRGKEKGISAKLLQKALDCCKHHDIQTLYLGTIDVFKAAMAFYEKNGFVRIDENELPMDFPHNPIDKVFYRLNI